MTDLGTGMNIVDLITKLGSFGLIIYVAVKLVPHVVSFLDEQRKALAGIAAGVTETHAVIRASEASIVKHVGDHARDVRLELSEQISTLENDVRAQVGDMREETARRFHNIRELVIWLGRRTGVDVEDGSVPPPPMSEQGREHAVPDLLEDTLDRRPSQEPQRASNPGRPAAARRRTVPAG